MYQIFEDQWSYSSSKIKGYNKPIQTIIEKCQFFNQNKQWINNIIYHYISLCTIYHHIALYMINHIYHSHFIVVLDGIICFSVFVIIHSISVKNTFSGLFFCNQKGTTRVFQWQKDINAVAISAFSSTKPCISFSIFDFSQVIWGNVHYVPEINFIS